MVLPQLKLLLLCGILLSIEITGCNARNRAPRVVALPRGRTHWQPRGGSSFGRTPAKPVNSGFASSQQQSDAFTSSESDRESVEVKEMLNSFLTRDSRNSFIGMWKMMFLLVLEGKWIEWPNLFCNLLFFAQLASMRFWQDNYWWQRGPLYCSGLNQVCDSGH